MNVQIIHAQLVKQHDRLGGCGPILHRNVEDFPFPANYNRESERKKTSKKCANETHGTKYPSQWFTHRTSS